MLTGGYASVQFEAIGLYLISGVLVNRAVNFIVTPKKWSNIDWRNPGVDVYWIFNNDKYGFRDSKRFGMPEKGSHHGPAEGDVCFPTGSALD